MYQEGISKTVGVKITYLSMGSISYMGRAAFSYMILLIQSYETHSKSVHNSKIHLERQCMKLSFTIYASFVKVPWYDLFNLCKSAFSQIFMPGNHLSHLLLCGIHWQWCQKKKKQPGF